VFLSTIRRIINRMRLVVVDEHPFEILKMPPTILAPVRIIVFLECFNQVIHPYTDLHEPFLTFCLKFCPVKKIFAVILEA
jgi:hypothetical protein